MILNASLTTKRLMMQRPVLEDAHFIRALISDPDVRRFLGGPASNTQISNYLGCNPAIAFWVVNLKSTKSPIGLVSITDHRDGDDKELSFQFLRSAWGMGYATEATSCILDHAISACGISQLIAETQSANTSSRRLLTRLGMNEKYRVQRFGAEQIIYSTIEHLSATA